MAVRPIDYCVPDVWLQMSVVATDSGVPDAWLQTSIAVHQMHGYRHQLLCTRCMVRDVNCCEPNAWLQTSSAVC